MNIVVVSLFDGISVLRQSLKELNIKPIAYISYEIDKKAIEISKSNHNDIIRYGDVTRADYQKLNYIFLEIKKTINDLKILLVGGSPCQGFSNVGKKHGLENVLSFEEYQDIEDKSIFQGQSWLFWELARAKRELKHDYFIMENVLMKEADKKIISNELGLKPIMINSNLVSYQNRKRLYWVNKPIPQPINKNISFQDFRDSNAPFRPVGKWVFSKWGNRIKLEGLPHITDNKVGTITTKATHSWQYYLNEDNTQYRNLTTAEIEQAQTLPIGYTKAVARTHAVKGLGNSFTNEVIKHILKKLLNCQKY